MFFRSRIYTAHPCVISHSVDREHVRRSAGVDGMCVGVSTQIIKAGDHRVLKSFVHYVLTPKISHAILHPFKVGNRDAAGVRQDIRNYENPFLVKNFIGGCGRWPIGTLS